MGRVQGCPKVADQEYVDVSYHGPGFREKLPAVALVIPNLVNDITLFPSIRK
jgi:hypothetical protein